VIIFFVVSATSNAFDSSGDSEMPDSHSKSQFFNPLEDVLKGILKIKSD